MTESGNTADDVSGEVLDDREELLLRQVHPNWIVDGEPSSQAFRPTPKDEGMLSVSRGSKTTPEAAYGVHTETLGLASGGTWGVSVDEAASAELSAYDQPLDENPAHAFIDFRPYGRGAAEARAKRLRAAARDRGCLFAPAN